MARTAYVLIKVNGEKGQQYAGVTMPPQFAQDAVGLTGLAKEIAAMSPDFSHLTFYNETLELFRRGGAMARYAKQMPDGEATLLLSSRPRAAAGETVRIAGMNLYIYPGGLCWAGRYPDGKRWETFTVPVDVLDRINTIAG